MKTFPFVPGTAWILVIATFGSVLHACASSADNVGYLLGHLHKTLYDADHTPAHVSSETGAPLVRYPFQRRKLTKSTVRPMGGKAFFATLEQARANENTVEHGERNTMWRFVLRGGGNDDSDSDDYFDGGHVVGSGEELRGGGVLSVKANDQSSTVTQGQDQRLTISVVRVGLSVSVVTITGFLWHYRSKISVWVESVLSKNSSSGFRTKLQESLRFLEDVPGGLVWYALALCLWNAAGLSSSPVETAAGAAFGFSRAILASGVGKSAGSVLAFTLGRLHKPQIEKKFKDYELYALVGRSVSEKPLRNVLLLRFSSFPELVKNLGPAVMPAVSLPTFLVAVLLQGLPFTLLWSAVGDEARRNLLNSDMAMATPSTHIKIGLLLAAAFGIFGSPTIVALWIAGLRKQYQNEKQDKEKLGASTKSQSKKQN